MKYRMKSDKAVSPIVGVMLMLVVTIILAAVVSSFSGGIVSEQPRPPQMSGVVYFESVGPANSGSEYTDPADYWDPDGTYGFSGNITYEEPTNHYVGYAPASGNNYIVIEHKGGDTIDISQTYIQLQSGTTKVTLDGANGSIVKVMGGGTLFKPGDKLKIIPTKEKIVRPVRINVTGAAADNIELWTCGSIGCLGLDNSTWNVIYDPYIGSQTSVWIAYDRLALLPNQVLQITLIDKNSNKPIFHWEFILNYNY